MYPRSRPMVFRSKKFVSVSLAEVVSPSEPVAREKPPMKFSFNRPSIPKRTRRRARGAPLSRRFQRSKVFRIVDRITVIPIYQVDIVGISSDPAATQLIKEAEET